MTKQTKTVSIAGYVTHETCSYMTIEQPFTFQTWKPGADSKGYVIVNELTIEIEVPLNFDPRPQLIKNLEAEQRKAMADFEKLNTDILRKIQELQALEMS